MPCLSSKTLAPRHQYEDLAYMMQQGHRTETPVVISANVEQNLIEVARVQARTMLCDLPMLRVSDIVVPFITGVELFHHVDRGRHTVKATVTLPHTKLKDVQAHLVLLSAQHYRHMMENLLGSSVLDASTLHASTNRAESLSLHWLTLQRPKDAMSATLSLPQDFVYLQHTSIIHSHLVSLWHSATIKAIPPQAHVDRATFHRCGLVVTNHPSGGHLVASMHLSEVAPYTSTPPKALCHLATTIASRLASTLVTCRLPPASLNPTLPTATAQFHHCRVCMAKPFDTVETKNTRAAVVCGLCHHHVCLSCTRPKSLVQHSSPSPLPICIHCVGSLSPRLSPIPRLLATPGSNRSSTAASRYPPSLPRHVAAPPSPASSSYSSSFSVSSSSSSTPAKPTSIWTPRHTFALAALPSAMYPHVQRNADRLVITPELEADMRDMGEAAVETLLGAVRLPMKKLVDTSLQTRPDVALYEHATSSLYTVKAVVVLPPYDVLELLALLDMRSTESFRHTMRILLDGVFVDGAVLHATPPSSPHSAESMTLNWLAVQNAKVHLPNRDYVFLKYGNCYALCGQCSPRRPAFMPTTSSTPSRPLKDTVAVSVWESVDVTECGPLPNDLNTLRLHFRQTGYVLEYMPRSRDASHGICISFFMSEEVPSSRSVSSLGKAWVVRMAQSVANLHHALVHQYVAEGRQRQLDMPRPMKPTAASRCHCCSKRFSILRRRHPCHLCSELVCKRCLDKQFQVDLCATCRLPSSMSLFKYWAS